MPSFVDVTIRANTDEAVNSLRGFASSMKVSMRDVQEGIGKGMDYVRQAYDAAKAVYENTVTPTMEYAKQVRELGRTIGASAEQTSMLIQAADDMGVSVDSLTNGLEAAIRKGVKPTIEGIGALSDQYVSIQDPIARTKFLMDNFGRSGADLAPLMAQGSAAIREMGKEAQMLGLVLGQDEVDAARAYEVSQDNLADSTRALSVAVGTRLIPELTNLADAWSYLIALPQRLKAQHEALAANLLETTGNYKEFAKAQIAAMYAAGELNEVGARRLTQMVEEGRVTEGVSAVYGIYTTQQYNSAHMTQLTTDRTREAKDEFIALQAPLMGLIELDPALVSGMKREADWLYQVGINAQMASGSYLELWKAKQLAAAGSIDADKAAQELAAMAGEGMGGFLQTGQAEWGISPYYEALKRQMAAKASAYGGGGGGAAAKEATLEGGETAKLITDITDAEAAAAQVTEVAAVSTDELGAAQQVLNTATGALVQTSPGFQAAVESNTTTLGDLSTQASGAAGQVERLVTAISQIPASKTSVVTVIHRDVYTTGNETTNYGATQYGGYDLANLPQAIRDALIQGGAYTP